MHNVYSLRNGAAPRALPLLVVAFALLVVPHAWLSLTPLRILLAAALVGGGFLLASSKPDRSVVPPQPRTVPSPHPHGTAPKPQAMSDGLLRIAADQKKTIEELRATVQSLEKQVAGMRLQLGVEVEGEEVSLWAEEFFARILRSELWRSRRTQRPLSLLVIEFTDENALRRQTQVSSGVDSSVWQDYAQTICRAVRGGDHVGLLPGGSLCVLLAETAPEAAKVARERLVKLIEKDLQRSAAQGASVLVDTAIVSFPRDGKDLDELLLAARKTILRAQRDRRTA